MKRIQYVKLKGRIIVGAMFDESFSAEEIAMYLQLHSDMFGGQIGVDKYRAYAIDKYTIGIEDYDYPEENVTLEIDYSQVVNISWLTNKQRFRHWMDDGNVAKYPDGYATQCHQYSNRIKTLPELYGFFLKNFIYVD